jgi:hypothetical protein
MINKRSLLPLELYSLVCCMRDRTLKYPPPSKPTQGNAQGNAAANYHHDSGIRAIGPKSEHSGWIIPVHRANVILMPLSVRNVFPHICDSNSVCFPLPFPSSSTTSLAGTIGAPISIVEWKAGVATIYQKSSPLIRLRRICEDVHFINLAKAQCSWL